MEELDIKEYQERVQKIDNFINNLPRRNKRKLLKSLKQDYTSILYSKLKYK